MPPSSKAIRGDDNAHGDSSYSYYLVFLSPSGPLSETAPYEIIRSRELNGQLGPKGSADAVDLVCDLHNTTANMGLCFIAYSDYDWICLHIFRHLQVSKAASYLTSTQPASLSPHT